MCEHNSALFVSLDQLSPVEAQQKSQQQPMDVRNHLMTTRSQNQAGNEYPDQQGQRSRSPKQPHLKLNERVVVYNKQGIGIHGSVRWIEEKMFAGEKLVAVGIEMVITILFNCCTLAVMEVFI